MGNRILLASLCAGLFLTARSGAAEEPPVVEVAHPVERMVTDYADFDGRLEAARSVDLRARVSGYLEKVHVDIGDRVRKGDLLFEIDGPEYQAEEKKATAALDVAKARLTLAEANYRRAAELAKRGAVSREELEKLAAEKGVAEAEVAAARANLEATRLTLSFTKVTAPFTGVITRRNVVRGEFVKANETIAVTLITLDPIHVVFDVPQETLLKLAREKVTGPGGKDLLGLPVDFALAGESGFPHRAKLDLVNVCVNPKDAKVLVRAALPNPEGRFIPGMFAMVRFPTGKPHKAILVPESAVQAGWVSDKKDRVQYSGKYVYIVNGKNVVERRLVDDFGLVHDGWREVIGRLKTDEWVVHRPGPSLEDGQKVQPKRVSEPHR
jgi:RND family efflux transporter MFP subunit